MADKICCVCEKLANPKLLLKGVVSDDNGKKIKMVAYFCDADMADVEARIQAGEGGVDIKGMKYKCMEIFDMEGKRVDASELKTMVEEDKS